MAELKIRLDDATKAKVMECARKKGISMNEYVKIVLKDYTMLPEYRALEDRFETIYKQTAAVYNELTRDMGEITFLDVYQAIEPVEDGDLFRFRSEDGNAGTSGRGSLKNAAPGYSPRGFLKDVVIR